jgi:hypothetical protein
MPREAPVITTTFCSNGMIDPMILFLFFWAFRSHPHITIFPGRLCHSAIDCSVDAVKSWMAVPDFLA